MISVFPLSSETLILAALEPGWDNLFPGVISANGVFQPWKQVWIILFSRSLSPKELENQLSIVISALGKRPILELSRDNDIVDVVIFSIKLFLHPRSRDGLFFFLRYLSAPVSAAWAS